MFCNKRIINIIGPSGSGKTTLGKELTKIGIPELISHTSRNIRLYDGEVDGVSYYFSTKEDILEMDKKNELVEHTTYSGNHYCLSKKEVINKFKKNDIVFVITEKDGNKALKKFYGNDMIITVFIFIDINTLVKRLKNRGDSKDDINQRLYNIEQNKEFDNFELADYVILNKDYEKSKKQLYFIVNSIKEELFLK